MIDEGRTAIQGLRSSRGDLPDLKQAFASVQNELALQTTIEFRTLVEGRPRQLRSALRDEVYWIGREAIVNAYRHSRARNIETTIEYGPDRFRIVVCDNGCGVDPNVLRSGRTGHWGIQGMRERAERISARLRVFSGARAGTEIELCVPGKVAYAQIRTSDPVLTNDPGKARGR
jgi:signal transduction histidine kinase